MTYPRYPEYKDSGVEWLGEVPAGWAVKPLKVAASVVPSNVDKKTKDGEEPVRLCNYVDVYYNDKITPKLKFMAASATADQVKKFALRQGDVIITKDSEDPTDIAVPALVSQDMPGVVCGYHLTMIRASSAASGPFLKSYFDSTFARSYFGTRANGLTRYGLGTYPLKNASVPLPPLAEQRQIAAFLDRECGKMDAMLAKQERLIALLREKRQALISHTVTKGLDPDAPMKDSGIPWLGEVPEHWKVKRLGHTVSKIGSGKTPRGGSEIYKSEGVMLLRSQNVYDTGLRLTDVVFIDKEIDKDMAGTRIQGGDVVLNITGASIGRSAIIPPGFPSANVNQHVCIIRPIVNFAEPTFIHAVLTSTATQAQIMSYQVASREGLNFDQVRNLIMCAPPLDAQRAIVAHLDETCGKIDRLTGAAHRAIALIKERRTALISAAVTGKIDVRDM